jgi:hypothetical protein
MSYLHCPVCSRAYNLAQQPSCPYCPVAATPVDPVDDLVAAAETLARALAQATPEQRAAAAARVQLPAMSTQLVPAPPPARPRRSHWLAALAVSAIDRIAPHAPKRLLRAVHAVKALAA